MGLLTFEAGAMPKLKALGFQLVALEASSSCSSAPDLGIGHVSALSDLCIWIDCLGEKAEEGVHELESASRIAASLLPSRQSKKLHSERLMRLIRTTLHLLRYCVSLLPILPSWV